MKILGFTITKADKTKKLVKLAPPKKIPRNNAKTKDVDSKKKNVTLPAGRISVPSTGNKDYTYDRIKGELNIVKPDFLFDSIPVIRKLYKVNEDLGLALFDLIQLTNTGHEIKFNQDVKPELADKMRAHLKNVSNNWHTGSAGIDGLVNKWIAQTYISGALSIEWVINKD